MVSCVDDLFVPVPERQSTSAIAAASLRDAIADGRLAPGQRLVESELAAALGVSRTPVREALRSLAAEGLVEMESGRGAVVKTHDAADLDDLFQMRALLEGEAAFRAASRIGTADLEALRASCDRYALIDPATDLAEFARENSLFHGIIHEAAGSPRLSSMIRLIADLPLVYRSYIWYDPQQKTHAAQYHSQIVASLASLDGERARILMKEHLLQARDLLVAYVREQEARKKAGLHAPAVDLGVQAP